MAEQFSLPQEQVLKELNGEGLGWVLPWGPSHPLIHAHEEVGIGPIPAAWYSLHCRPPRPKRRRRVGGPGPPCRLPCTLQASAAASGRRSTPSSRAPCMRRWPQYSAWARVSVSGGPGPTLVQPYISSATSGAPPLPFCTLCPLLASCVLGLLPL